MSRHVIDARARLDDIERIRARIKQAMHRASESDIDVAHDRPDLRIRAAVELILDEEVDQKSEWLRQATAMDAEQERQQVEAGGQ